VPQNTALRNFQLLHVGLEMNFYQLPENCLRPKSTSHIGKKLC